MESLGHHARARLAVIVAMTACALLLLVASQAPAAAPTRPASATLGGQGRGQGAYVAGWALLGPRQRVHGGVVRVWTMDARSILAGAPDRTSKTGTFDVRVRRLPRRFVVSVTGGRVNGWKVGGTLGVVVERRRVGDAVVVTPLTTVIAARVGTHWSVARAEREARRLFKLPSWYDVYGDARIDGRAFDGGRFVRAAHRRGGLQRYADRLAGRIGRGHVTFRGPAVAHSSGIGAGALSLLGLVGKGAVGGVGSAAVGKLLATLGFGDGAQLAEMRRTLEEIKLQLEQISRQLIEVRADIAKLENQIAVSTYAGLVNGLRLERIGTENDRIARWLAWLVDESIGCGSGDRTRCQAGIPQGADAQTWCLAPSSTRTHRQAMTCDLIRLMEVALDGGDYDELQGRLVGRGRLGVIEAYQQLLYTNAKTGSGFITPDYRAQAAKVIERYSWMTALMAQYFAEHSALKGLPSEVVLAQVRQAERNIAELEALAPRAVPRTSFIDLRTRKQWSVLPNPAKRCGDRETGHEWLWWRPGDEVLGDKDGCSREMNAAVERLHGLAGWTLPTLQDLAAVYAPWTANRSGTLASWLREQARLPDLGVVAAASPPLPPDAGNIHNRSLMDIGAGQFFGNPGTSAGLATSTCQGMYWGTGMGIRLWKTWYDAQVHGYFCNYVRLDDGTAPQYCERAFEWELVRYDRGMPCRTPISTYRVSRGILKYKSNGPLDYGHPTIHLVQRRSDDAEGWYRMP